MKYAVKAAEMKAYDECTINNIGIPSMVLMERAALCVVSRLSNKLGNTPKRILIAAGTGNNGGDGLAVGRLLALKGHRVDFFLAGNPDRMTEEAEEQLNILKNLGFSIQRKLKSAEYDMVIDALLGIGLSREVTGDYADAVDKINQMKSKGAYICGVDIPSGICADTGRVLGCAVRADITVAFAFAKRGHLLYPGKAYCGKLVVEDIGISERGLFLSKPAAFYYEKEDLKNLLPYRAPDGNKGTFGKVLLIAGSKDISGACILCGSSILRSGAGMLKIITPACNRQIIQLSLPEAMLQTYEEHPDESKIKQSLKWCDVVVAGPGMGTDENGYTIMKWILEEDTLPMVIDADGLNLMALHADLMHLAAIRRAGQTVLTPHPAEFNRLSGTDMEAYQGNREQLIRMLSQKLHCIVVAKDAVTVVAGNQRDEIYINNSGNNGMATAGSGDVLAGLLGALLGQGMGPFDAACLAVYLHGVAGEQAAEENGCSAVVASDIIKKLMQVMKGRKNTTEGKACI